MEEDRLKSGKYKGLTEQQVLEKDPDYVLSTLKGFSRVHFSDDILEKAQEIVYSSDLEKNDKTDAFYNLFTAE